MGANRSLSHDYRVASCLVVIESSKLENSENFVISA